MGKALDELVPVKGFKYCTEKFPIKYWDAPSGDELEQFNQQLENDIKDIGDTLSGRGLPTGTMTRWNTHEYYESFRQLGNVAIRFCQKHPVTNRTTLKGEKEVVPLYLKESWGLIYNKGDSTRDHMHWPSIWSYVYCVRACPKCVPLVFPNVKNGYEISPKKGRLIIFPGIVTHEVPEQKCDHERVMISGNLDTAWTPPDLS